MEEAEACVLAGREAEVTSEMVAETCAGPVFSALFVDDNSKAPKETIFSTATFRFTLGRSPISAHTALTVPIVRVI